MKRFEHHATKLLLSAAALLYFVPLGARALWDSDEGRYAEIAREMLELKDWISPHLNYVLYFEKPPLLYWLTALAEAVLGRNAFAARFWCAAFAVLTVGLTYLIGKRWKSERLGLLAGAILGTSVLFVALSQFLVLDMALTFWTTLVLFAFSRLLSERAPAALPRYAMLAAVGAAGGTLTKGPVAVVLPAAALVATVAVGRLGSQYRKISWAPAAAAFAVLVAPWFVLVSLRHPFFVPFFFVHEHVARFFTNVHQRNQPFYFFAVTVAVGFLPWSVFLPRAVAPWFSRRGAAMKRDPVGALLVVWSALIFIFFSVSHSKLVGYILPIFPALALLVADAFETDAETTPAPRWIAGGLAALCCVFIGVLVAAKWPNPPAFLLEAPGNRLLAQSGLVTATLGVGVFVLVGVWGMRRMRPAVVGVIAAQLLLFCGVFLLAGQLDPYLSAKGIALTLAERAQPQDRIVAYGISYENHLQSLLFYLTRRLVVMGDAGELSMGSEYDPQAAEWFVPEERAQDALLAEPANTWVVTDDEHWKPLEDADQSQHFVLIERQGSIDLLQKVE